MRAVFIGGCDRSGTTLLGSMLGTHPDHLCVPEMPFKFGLQGKLEQASGDVGEVLRWLKSNWRFQIWGLDLSPEEFVGQTASLKEIIERIVREYGKRDNKLAPLIWVDHTPQNIRHTQMLLRNFPDAGMIHIVRDGRAVASSLMKVDWGPNRPDTAAHFWAECLARGFAAELSWGPGPVIRVRYEDLVQDPEETLGRICAHLEISYEPGMVHGTGFEAPRYLANHHALVGTVPDASRVNSWRQELDRRQVEIFESVAGDLLVYLGYTPEFGMQSRRISRKERAVSGLYDIYRKTCNWYWARRRIRRGLTHR